MSQSKLTPTRKRQIKRLQFITEMLDNGHSQTEIAARLGISRQAVSEFLARHQND